MDKISQIDINYDSKKNNFEKLIDFVQTYSNKRINICIASAADIEKLRIINKLHNHIYLKLNNLVYTKEIKPEDNFKYYFTFPIGNYSLLNQILTFPISDIYIKDDLCYSLQDIKNICTKHNIQIRAIVNKIPSSGPIGLTIKDPIFRPEDSEFLSQFIDTIEFDCGNDWHQIETLYKVWIENHQWFGNLQEINSDINFYFPNRTIINLYKNKYNCDLICVKGSNCGICKQVLDLALEADKKNLIYKQKEG